MDDETPTETARADDAYWDARYDTDEDDDQ